MTTPRFAVAALLWTTVLSAIPGCGSAQQLVLSADVGQTEFFEDEPIYLLLRLQNVAADTAWTFFFGFFSPAVTMSARLGHGHLFEVTKPVLDYRSDPSWRGEPVPPGASLLKTMVLQDIMGAAWDLRSHLFAHHLPPDQYELHVEFHAHWGLPGTTPLTVEAAPITFRVRARTPAEENQIGELEAMRHMGWDTARVAGYPRSVGYHTALLHWAERRLSENPDDPFLPFLLYNGMYVVGKILEEQVLTGKVPRFDPDTSHVVSRLRLAVIERRKASTAGAHLVQGLTARHLDQLAVLAEELGSTAGGEMSRYQVARNQHPR